jgi:hypothetical protein
VGLKPLDLMEQGVRRATNRQMFVLTAPVFRHVVVTLGRPVEDIFCILGVFLGLKFVTRWVG